MPFQICIDTPRQEDWDVLVSVLKEAPGVEITKPSGGNSPQIPHLVVIMIPQTALDRLTLIRTNLIANPSAKVMVVSPDGGPTLARICVALGASGFVASGFHRKAFAEAVESIQLGKVFFDDRTKEGLLSRLVAGEETLTSPPLNKTQWMTLALHSLGVHPSQMAAILHVQPATILKRLHQLRQLAGLESNFELRHWAKHRLDTQ